MRDCLYVKSNKHPRQKEETDIHQTLVMRRARHKVLQKTPQMVKRTAQCMKTYPLNGTDLSAFKNYSTGEQNRPQIHISEQHRNSQMRCGSRGVSACFTNRQPAFPVEYMATLGGTVYYRAR